MSKIGTSPTDAVLGAALVALIAICLTAWYSPPLDWGGDSAMYLLHAENLAAGDGYNDTGYIQNPQAFLAPKAYPPGFPLTIAPVVYFFGVDITALQAVSSLIYALGLAAFAALTRQAFGRTASGFFCWLTLIFLVGFNPAIVTYATALRADGLFLTLVCVTLWLFDIVYRRLFRDEPALLIAFVAGLAAGAATLSRVFGATIIAAVPVFELVRWRRVSRPGAVYIAVAVAFWILMSAWVSADNVAIERGGDAGYWSLLRDTLLADVAQVIGTSLENTLAYGYFSHNYLWPSDKASAFTPIFVGACGLFTITGFVQRLRQRLSVLDLFCLLYFIALLPWLARSTRYLLPLAPFIFFYTLVGLQYATARYRRGFVALLSLILLVYAQQYATSYGDYFEQLETRRADAPTGPLATQVFEYIATQTPKGSVVLFIKPRVLSLLAERPASSYADSFNQPRSDEELLRYARSVGVDYILDGPVDDSDILKSFIRSYPTHITLVYRNAAFKLYALDGAD